MQRIASLSPHEPWGCTLRVTLTALLRLRLKSRQIRADSGRSCRVKEQRLFCECLRAAEYSAALFIFTAGLNLSDARVRRDGKGLCTHGCPSRLPRSLATLVLFFASY